MVAPDEEAARFNAVWLGPDGITLPIRARYVSWGLWAVLQAVAWTLIAALPGVGVAVACAWGFMVSVLATRALMLLVGSDLPLSSLFAVASAEIATFGRGERDQTWRVSTAGVRIRSLASPTLDQERAA